MSCILAQMHTWLQTLRDALLDLERWERREHERLLKLDLEDRVQQGVSWSPVRVEEVVAESRGWEVTLRGVMHDGITPGDRVQLGTCVGRVVGVDPGVAELRLSSEPTGAEVEVLRLFDPGTLVRYREGLETIPTKGLTEALVQAQPVEWVERLAEHGLNAAQNTALHYALEQPYLAWIHGPPGTGKTYVIAELLRRLVEEGDRPWALADSNVAVDHLAVVADSRGLSVVRLGVLHRMGSKAADLSLQAWMKRSPLAYALSLLERDLSRVRSRKGGGRELGPLFDERRRLRAAAREWALAQAEVFCTTLGTLAGLTAGEPRLPVPHTAVVDEATQALEPAIWCAARCVERLVLVGDPHQLGPVVKQPGNPLQTSILERLLHDAPAPMLTVQHRMHRQIQALVQPVYGERYQPHASVADRTLEAPFPTVCFVDTAGSGHEEQRDPVSRSLYNPLEIQLVQIALAALEGHQVVVLAPYSAQVQRLRRALPGVEVATINSFQGREADVVLLCFVRSNPDAELGFLADERRLTVALTRARRLLWMCGDSATLSRNPRFADLLGQVEGQGGLQSVWEPQWAAAMERE